MPPTDYRAVETLGWVDGFRGAAGVFAVPVLWWMRAISSRLRHRKNDPNTVDAHRVYGLK